ncbi:MAG: hypothetical protein WAQ08_09830 [Aquabacterium sp.]|jgi:hypothetical protein|uniref:hypothetical protein n=1 Tax=Aquabacterium sp. TaxID=1872578 RepID=UPI003BAFD28B
MPWRTCAISRKALLCLVPAVLLTGCAGLRPYSENRHQQAMAAQTAWKAVDLPALVVTERGNLDRLLATELATSIRDHRLRYMLGASLWATPCWRPSRPI